MIHTFNCKETQLIWEGYVSKKLPAQIQQIARRKLRMLNNAKQIADLRIPPNNRLEALKGDRKGWYSIRVNKQWRVCFLWSDGVAQKVKIIDYH